MKKPFLLKLFATVMLICLSMAMLTACEDVNVEVTFIVDDEVYAVVNLQDGDTVEMPEDPTKDGFVFDGWYLDKDIWKKPFIGKVEDTTLVKLDVYAKWVAGESQCNHMWSQWTVGVEPTCSTEGKQGRYCLKCSKTEVEDIEKLAHTEEVIPAVEATCYKEGSTEGKKCSVCNEVLIAPQTVAKTEHNYVNGVCSNEGCNAKDPNYVEPVKYSEGLEFTLSNDGLSYSVTGIGTCTDTDVIIPTIHNEKPVTRIGEHAFYDCSQLTSVIIPDSVTSIGELAFSDCSGLESITVAEGNTKYHSKTNCLIETESKRLIAGCKNSIIPNDGSVTYIVISAFEGCSGLTSINIPNGVTTIGQNAFNRYTNLVSLTISNSVIDIHNIGAFSNCSSLVSITVAEDNTKYHSENNCIIETASKTLIVGCKSSIIPDNGSVTSIGYDAFSHCSGLTNVIIPNSVTSIKQYAFYGCNGLISITIPDSVTSIGNYAFDYCDNLQYNEYDNGLYLGNENNPYYALIKAKDESITSCKINDKTNVIAGSAFEDCCWLTSITTPDSVTSICYCAFFGCISLTSIIIPNSVTSIDRLAFWGCDNLIEINFNGTKEQWRAIKKGSSWNRSVPVEKVNCTDGEVEL